MTVQFRCIKLPCGLLKSTHIIIVHGLRLIGLLKIHGSLVISKLEPTPNLRGAQPLQRLGMAGVRKAKPLPKLLLCFQCNLSLRPREFHARTSFNIPK